MSIRAKMTLVGIFPTTWGSMQANFSCVYDQNKEEDRSFQKATPSGSANFSIDNAAVFPQLVIGKSYYFDITPVDEGV